MVYKFVDYTQINISSFNDDELKIYNELINKYKNEYKRVLKIKQNFINNYIDVTILKNAHLKNNCGKRKYKTSMCDITNFLDSINNNNDTIKSIKNEYNNILNFNKIKNIKINNSHNDCCFIINKTYNLFNYYLHLFTFQMPIL